MDMIYHGSTDEKDLISFMMLDEAGIGKVVFHFYENFLIQYFQMVGELGQNHAIDKDAIREFSLEIFNLMANINREESDSEEVTSRLNQLLKTSRRLTT